MKRAAMGLAIAFACLACAFILSQDWQSLVEPVPHYRMTLLWMSEDTLHERLRALLADHRTALASLYQMIHSMGLGFLLVTALTGLTLGWMRGQDTVLPVKQARIIAVGMGGLVVLSPLLNPLLAEAAEIPDAQVALASMPAYWMFGLVASASILGLYMTLAAHDLALISRDRLVPWLAAKLHSRISPAE